METIRTLKAVMIPTDKSSDLVYRTKDGIIHLKKYYGMIHEEMGDTHAQIYLLSNEEIKEGDWCLLDNNVGESTGYEVKKCLKSYSTDGVFLFEENDGSKFTTGRCDKIIATTDTSLITDEPVSGKDIFYGAAVMVKEKDAHYKTLPRINEPDLQYLVAKEWDNKASSIKEVQVVMEYKDYQTELYFKEHFVDISEVHEKELKIKTNIDNTIIIHKQKD